jgi:hypothetical protein
MVMGRMVMGRLKTIPMRRADGARYAAVFTDLQLYQQQFRNWNLLPLRGAARAADVTFIHRKLPQ